MSISKKFKESFANAETLGELKNVYVHAIRQYTSKKDRKECDNLYIKYFEEVKTWNKTREGVKYEKATDEVAETFVKALNTVFGIKGLSCRMNGTWLWVIDEIEGSAKENRGALKEVGFRFAPNKKMWYLAPKNAKRSRKHYTYEQINEWHAEEEI